MTDKAQDQQKAQEPPKAQEPQKPKAPEVPLVKVTKDGETLEVHPSCVAAHETAGWKVAK